MPIIIPQNLPAAEILEKENVFVMNEYRASRQDIRPLNIAILNLMPVKIKTETHLLRVLSNFPIQIRVILLTTKSHESKNTPKEHLETFYRNFDEVKTEKFDGMIVTGAPVEHLDFAEVDYWEELKDIMDFSIKNVFSTFHICWAAQAALYHHFGIEKYHLDEKMFGVFPHTVTDPTNNLVKGFDDVFYAPHSRYTEVKREDIDKVKELKTLAVSEEAGVFLVASKDGRLVFQTGHLEYEALTLKEEYERDLQKGLNIKVPKYYFPNDDPLSTPIVNWRSHANLLFSNWLNYFVYQETPYDLDKLK